MSCMVANAPANKAYGIQLIADNLFFWIIKILAMINKIPTTFMRLKFPPNKYKLTIYVHIDCVENIASGNPGLRDNLTALSSK